MVDLLSINARTKVVERLIEDAVSSAQQNPDWLHDVFRNGHSGFSSMSDADLIQAYIDAGLDGRFDDFAHTNFEPED